MGAGAARKARGEELFGVWTPAYCFNQQRLPCLRRPQLCYSAVLNTPLCAPNSTLGPAVDGNIPESLCWVIAIDVMLIA
jgi:hypothetical protein